MDCTSIKKCVGIPYNRSCFIVTDNSTSFSRVPTECKKDDVRPPTRAQAEKIVPTQTVNSDVIHEQAPLGITEKDNGKTFVYNVTSRFSIDLNPQLYPFIKNWNCVPSGIIGYVSNLSVKGPDSYPIGFEAVRVGQCKLTNKDFSITIGVMDIIEPPVMPGN